jgi:hypothetical protein
MDWIVPQGILDKLATGCIEFWSKKNRKSIDSEFEQAQCLSNVIITMQLVF